MCCTRSATRRPAPTLPCLLDDQRHVDRLVVEEQAVLLLAVIAEAFAVIRQQHDRRSVVELMRLQVVDEAADDLVGVGDLAVVGRVLREARRRRVGLVRLVEMQEQERARRCRCASSQCSAIASESAPSRCTLAESIAPARPAGMSPSKKSKPWPMPVSLRST